MKKIFIPIIIIIFLVGIIGGYYWWQKNQTTIPSIPSIPSAPPAAEIPTKQGPTCEQLKAIPSAQYAPPDIRDKFLKCFPERK